MLKGHSLSAQPSRVLDTICETIASVHERYHNSRSMSLGMEQDSDNMDNETNEMWIARNGPRMIGGAASVMAPHK